MPEGPSIVMLKEAIQQFKNKTVVKANGYADIDFKKIAGKKLTDIRTLGKNLFLCFGKKLSIRIHLMMFGSYRVNAKKKTNPKLHLEFRSEFLNFYACVVKFIEGDLDKLYDFSSDIMSKKWSTPKAKRKLKEQPSLTAVDALMDQKIFAGVGNIIKNEVLYRCKIHPQSIVAELPLKKLNEMIKSSKQYCFEFLDQKKEGTLSKNWQVYTKKKCKRDGATIIKEYIGKTKRRTFFCNKCQELYT